VKPLLNAYRVLATVVGLSIITLVVVGVPLKYVHTIWPSVLPEGSGGWKLGSNINLYLGTAEERLVSGRLDHVAAELRAQREEAARASGWVMDTYLLRRVTGVPVPSEP
jgi:hypothetical protein